MRRGFHCLLLWTLVSSAAFTTSGCDIIEATEDTILLPATTVELCFRFERTSTSQELTVVSEASASLARYLQNEGYSTADVVTATITEGDLRFAFPLNETFALFEEADIRLRAGGREASVLRSWSGSNTRSMILDVNETQDVGAIVSASSFEGVLVHTGARSTDGMLEVMLTLVVQLEVQGV